MIYLERSIQAIKDAFNNSTGEIIGKVNVGEWIEAGTALLQTGKKSTKETEADTKELAAADSVPIARVSGTLLVEDGHIYIQYEEKEEREYIVPSGGHIRVKNGSQIKAGEQITDGSIDPQDILHVMGREAVQHYLVAEVQKVYRSQGVNINDKHIEIIVRQMLRRVRVESPGDTDLLPGDLIDRFEYENKNAKVLAEGGEPATAQTVLLGITRASLNTSSWLAAASFQETTRVLTEAALWGSTDKLLGLKENVIIGRLIPTQESESPEELELSDELAAEALLEGGQEDSDTMENMDSIENVAAVAAKDIAGDNTDTISGNNETIDEPVKDTIEPAGENTEATDESPAEISPEQTKDISI